MADKRIGSQVPTTLSVVPYAETKGPEAVASYEKCKRTAFEWQKNLINHILAVDEEGLWAHSTFGYQVPRQNGKGEILIIREKYALEHGERVLHTAHRTATSHAAWEKLINVLEESGLVEGEDFTLKRQFGLEEVRMSKANGGGKVSFRTRSSKGGLGESYDVLIIDEAQEYTKDEKSALQYTISASDNPQTIMCGTPPTKVSIGTVFQQYRKTMTRGGKPFSGWAEWSVADKVEADDKEAWYQTNPSLGLSLKERTIYNEIDEGDELDFIIQRLGYWFEYNQASAITRSEWNALKVEAMPKLTRSACLGVKYGKDNTNVSVSVAVKTEDGKNFIEALDCRPIRDGNDWIIAYITGVNPDSVVIDGQNGQTVLEAEIKDSKYKGKVIKPTVKEIITANALWEQGIFDRSISHMEQPSLEQVVANCEKRAIGSNGGFGYQTFLRGADVSIMDSALLANWALHNSKEKKQQRLSY